MLPVSLLNLLEKLFPLPEALLHPLPCILLASTQPRVPADISLGPSCSPWPFLYAPRAPVPYCTCLVLCPSRDLPLAEEGVCVFQEWRLINNIFFQDFLCKSSLHPTRGWNSQPWDPGLPTPLSEPASLPLAMIFRVICYDNTEDFDEKMSEEAPWRRGCETCDLGEKAIRGWHLFLPSNQWHSPQAQATPFRVRLC